MINGTSGLHRQARADAERYGSQAKTIQLYPCRDYCSITQSVLQHNSHFCCTYINYLSQTILQGSWKQLSVSSAVYNSAIILFSGTEIWNEQALTQLFSSYFLDNFVYSCIQASESARMASKSFQIWRHIDTIKNDVFTLRICMTLARAHGRHKEPSASLILEFWQERECAWS